MMSSLETHTGPLAGSASQIAWSMQEETHPNCIESGASYLSVVSFSVTLQLFSIMLSMRCGYQCACGTATIQNILSLSPNTRTASMAGIMMINPSFTCRCISPRMKMILSVHRSPLIWQSPGPALSRAVPYEPYILTKGY